MVAARQTKAQTNRPLNPEPAMAAVRCFLIHIIPPTQIRACGASPAGAVIAWAMNKPISRIRPTRNPAAGPRKLLPQRQPAAEGQRISAGTTGPGGGGQEDQAAADHPGGPFIDRLAAFLPGMEGPIGVASPAALRAAPAMVKASVRGLILL